MMRTIVVAFDGSPEARRALERAVLLARAFDGRLAVCSVAPVSTPAAGRSIGSDPTDTVADHMAELADARAYLEGEGVRAEYVEAVGHPADSILTAARERSADLIVLGSRELGLVARLLGQSVSDTVAHGAQCDVLLVH